ncbi:ubiquitin-2/rad60 SUMO-like protein [Nitzschia inconspicua]|uniref:Ubiquitin-2/rad60 SUMO-like protein n=1 Tax=Nitzschia inconspicua TaxID=303405 RepID=A0A9K3LQI4_9STRA|nr:ubiquitin-2/rad60 SUMO-like protein [Nitzschia inconspicua]KAG7366724.1 ubiquitin-2/rad60 SUMO-like protein [Nitzschia inconspicua]
MSDNEKAADEGNETITIRIRDQTGEETFFKIKKTTKMQKVFETYASRKGIQSSSIRFMLDGERILPDATPKMLEMDDQDQIDCMLEQTGGRSF